MNIKEIYIPYKDSKTYCQIIEGNKKKTPLVFLHGGPGSTHNSFEILYDFAIQDERTLIMYDQQGCGQSKNDNIESYDVSLYIDEFENLISKLNLSKIHLLGHSFGGMLIIMLLTTRNNSFIDKVILSSTLSSASLWKKECYRLINYLSDEDKEAIESANITHNYESDAYKKAMKDFKNKYIARDYTEDDPPCLTREKYLDKKAYLQLWGPSEFEPLGKLKDYEYTDRLNIIKNDVLIISGTDDESTPLINKTIYDNLTCRKKWVLLNDARHMAYFDQKDNYLKALKDFLKDE